MKYLTFFMLLSFNSFAIELDRESQELLNDSFSFDYLTLDPTYEMKVLPDNCFPIDMVSIESSLMRSEQFNSAPSSFQGGILKTDC
jgi:hypothetical protein